MDRWVGQVSVHQQDAVIDQVPAQDQGEIAGRGAGAIMPIGPGELNNHRLG